MKTKTFVLLFAVFCFMLILNTLKPLSSDDYFLAFVWPEGVGINGPLPVNAKRIACLSDIYESLKAYYSIWGGRIPGQTLMTLFVWQGKEVFNIFNAFMFIVLIMEIYWLSHEGKISFNFNPSYIVWLFFSLWTFNISFNDTILWISGACNYLWMMVILLLFLIPFVQNYYDRTLFNGKQSKLAVSMFILGIFAGDSLETFVCWIIIALSFWIYKCYKNDNLQYWKVSGLTGLCIGYTLLIFAPGNSSRVALQQNSDSFLIPTMFLFLKLIESIEIIAFHLFLWYFLLKFYYSYSKSYNLNIKSQFDPYVNFSKVCVGIALGSGVIMFMIQSEGYRPSFANLVFLIIAASTLFRAGETTGIKIIREPITVFLKMIGYCYLVLTITCSLYGNYVNWKQWNTTLSLVDEAYQKRSNSIIEVSPYPIRENSVLTPLSGFHIIVMPFSGKKETDPINRTFARYYGIKGIKITSSN